jgi:hypothetical protein
MSAVLEWRGRALTIAEWAKELGCDPRTIRQRLKYGWPVERALGEPVNEAMRERKPRARRHLQVVPLATVTRGECREWLEPCRLTSCRYHVEHRGKPSRGASGAQLDASVARRAAADHEETCSLNYAELGPMSEREIAEALGLSQQRVHEISENAITKLKRAARDNEAIRLWLQEQGL